MSDSARLIALALCFAVMIYVGYNAYDAAMTEALDDPTLRLVYKSADDLVQKPKELMEFMKTRLADNYQHNETLIHAMKGKPDQITPMQQNKAQMLEALQQAANVMSVDKYEHKILDIKFSEDKKYAYVSSTESSSGNLNYTLPDGKKLKLPYNAASGCIDTLTVVKPLINFVRSDCTNKIQVLQ